MVNHLPHFPEDLEADDALQKVLPQENLLQRLDVQGHHSLSFYFEVVPPLDFQLSIHLLHELLVLHELSGVQSVLSLDQVSTHDANFLNVFIYDHIFLVHFDVELAFLFVMSIGWRRC